MITVTGIVVCILAFLVGLLILKILCKLFKWSAKILWKLICNACVGFVILLVFNLVGGLFNAAVAVTPFNALLVGVLGVPGLLLLLLLGM